LGLPIVLAILFWLLVLVVITVGVYLAVRALRSPASPRHESAGELLDRRFAAGEIDTDEYYERRAGLRP